ncbi:dockerin type I domain-containing protein [Fontivita pretiosa]|uniref:dockerin type I domain-containing protein n=1 Tax=Fontivita pretiosa TaxID=2989684 RepID=UPI003D17DE4B
MAATPIWLNAVPITWIGGNTTWTDATGAGNWTPADEPDPDDEAIFNQPNSVTLGSSNSIAALTMSNGADLSLNGFSLTVNGLVSLVDAGTNLNVGGTGALLTADEISINTGAGMNLSGGQVTVIEETGNGSLDINSGGDVTGFGTIQFSDSLSAVTTVMFNDGTLSASRTSLIIGGAPPAGTLAINAADADARINLDGTGENGVVNVFRNQTLDINVTLSDAFSGDINLFHNSVLDIASAWSINAGATIDVDNGFVAGNPPLIPSIPADVAYIRGGAFTQTDGTITVVDSDGALQFDAAFTMSGGTLTNNGEVIFNANATIGAGANFLMPGSTSSITVEPGMTVTVNQANFNPDGGGFLTNVITINAGATLALNLGTGADDVLGGVTNLNGGTLTVTDSTDSAWGINRAVNTGANTGISVISGNTVALAGADLNVGTNSTLDINAPSTWTSTTALIINSGGVARIDGNATVSGSSFTGTGALRTGGDITITTATTINMPGGTVDLDGTDSFGNTVTLNSTSLTINASTMNSFGGTILGSDTLVLNDSLSGLASLIVNITDPNAEWTLVAGSGGTIILSNGGVLNINALGGNLGGGGIQGSDFNMNGVTNITGNSIWTARTDIAGTVNVAAASSFNLRGGTLVDLNTLSGGTITGAGAVRALIDQGLSGFGVIDTSIEFANNTELRADNGILNINGTILDVGVIGTADTDGILNVTNAWNSNVAGFVELKGGEIRGAAITNGLASGINGFGLLSAPVINNTRLDAENGTLIVETPLNNNDWDGAGNVGSLVANTGDLEIRDTVGVSFLGTVFVNDNREVFVNGFELQFDAGSTLRIDSGGRYRSTNSTNFNSTVNVTAGTGTIQITGNATFGAASTNTLTGTLRLANTLTVIPVGASFTGGGALRNNNGSILRLNDGVVSSDLGVLVQNDGTIQLATDTAAGQAQLVDFQQTAIGAANMQLGGSGLNDFDRITVLGNASIDGHLQLGLIAAYNPSYLVQHEIISAISVTGMFDTVGGLIVNANKYLAVTYDPNSVLVTAAIPGDANLDGLVNVLDLDVLAQNWQLSGRSWVTADFDGSGRVNIRDLYLLATHWGFGLLAPSSSPADLQAMLSERGLPATVPEPAVGAVLALLGVFGSSCARLRRR